MRACPKAWFCKLVGVDDEGFECSARFIVRHLLRRRLHQIGRSRQDWSADAAVERNLGRAYSVNDDAGLVWRISNLELVLQV